MRKSFIVVNLFSYKVNISSLLDLIRVPANETKISRFDIDLIFNAYIFNSTDNKIQNWSNLLLGKNMRTFLQQTKSKIAYFIYFIIMNPTYELAFVDDRQNW